MERPAVGKLTIDFQDRDFALLRGLFECRVMTLAHIAKLYFDGREPYTTKRLQKLKAGGFVGERKRRMNEASVLFLSRAGFNLLKERGQLSDYPPLGIHTFEARSKVSELKLRHELEVMDVKAAVHFALRSSEKYSLTEFSTWPLLYQFTTRHPTRGKDVPVKPDAFFRIHEKETGSAGYSHDCFLEVDRSHEVHSILVNKAVSYANYYHSGDFAVRFGGSRTDAGKFPFRALMVFKTPARRNNAAHELVQPTARVFRQTWLTTLGEVVANPLGPIWIRPSDYRDVTHGTPFCCDEPISGKVYRPRPEREAFVESRIKKLALLE